MLKQSLFIFITFSFLDQVLAADTYTQVAGQKAVRPTMGSLGGAGGKIEFWDGAVWLAKAIENIFITATSVIDINGQKVTNAAEPTTGTDYATKNYVDNNGPQAIGIKGYRSFNVDASNNIVVQPVGTVTWDTGSHLQSREDLTGASFSLTSSSSTCSTCGGSHATFGYLYIFDMSGTFKYDYSDTPHTAKLYKTGDRTHIYVGIVRKNLAFSYANGKVVYGAGGGLLLVASGLGCTNVGDSSFVPATATSQQVIFGNTCTMGTGLVTASLFNDSMCSTGGACFVYQSSPFTGSGDSVYCDIQGATMYVNQNGTGISCTSRVSILGFIE